VPQGTFALPTTTMAVDPRVDDIIVRCLRAEPEERFQTAAEVKQLLEDIRTGKPLPAASNGKRDAKQVTIMRPSARRSLQPVRSQGNTRPAVVTARGNMDRLAKLEEEAKAKQKKLVMMGAIIFAIAALAAGMAMVLKGDPEPVAEVLPSAPEKVKPKDINFAPPRPEPAPAPTPAPAPPSVVEAPTEKPMEKPVEPDPEVSVPTPPSAPIGDPFPALTKVKKDFIERYKTEIRSKLSAQEKDYGEKYKAALAKLEPDFLSRNDASGVIQVRSEIERFSTTSTPPAKTEYARNEKVADVQRKLVVALTSMKQNFVPMITKLNTEFSEMLAKLVISLIAEGKKEEAEAAKNFREAGMGVVDYLGATAGFADANASAPAGLGTPSRTMGATGATKGEVSEVDVARASNGGSAEAEVNPDNMIDGVHGKDSTAKSSVGGSLVVTFDKIYLVDTVYIHLPTKEDNSYRYVLEGSVDGKVWNVLARKTDEDTRSYQFITFAPTALKAVRILPKRLSGTQNFTVEEISVYSPGKAPNTWGPNGKR
jgi:hypothetical protein